ncbi:MAG: YciI family protein [bacterium]
MQFMALIYSDPATHPAPGSPEQTAMLDDYRAATRSYQSDGCYLSGDALLGVGTAKSLRIRGDKSIVMDGPFAETKEHLGGYYLLDCPSIDEAVKLAERIPAARFGTIEVRPVMQFR